VLLHRARTDVQVAGNFLVAASLGEQMQDFLITRRNFDGIQIDH